MGAQSYATSSESTTDLSLEKEELLAEIQEDRTLRLKYNELPLIRFWIYEKTKYPVISEEAMNILFYQLLKRVRIFSSNKHKKQKKTGEASFQ